MVDSRSPAGWNKTAHRHWCEGERQLAFDDLLATINSTGANKPVPLVLQLAYYIFQSGRPADAIPFLERSRLHHPRHPELLRNLAVCLSYDHQYQKAVVYLQELLQLVPDDYVAYDSLAKCFGSMQDYTAAARAGTQSLVLKDSMFSALSTSWSLPDCSPTEFIRAHGGQPVIAFSLWGKKPRYLRGAIDNVLAAREFYPGWILRFYSDASVPAELCSTLVALGADVREEKAAQNLRQRLAWRFKVANDPEVSRFLVRDVDSVPSEREASAVQQWLDSDQWFHVMRDWWTHTDLVLAGMWGGVAGILPDLGSLLDQYQSPNMETANVDQWFLRDKVWCHIRCSCLVHDRCFTPPGAKPWPLPAPNGNLHVGQDIYSARRLEQQHRLAEWIDKLPCLRNGE